MDLVNAHRVPRFRFRFLSMTNCKTIYLPEKKEEKNFDRKNLVEFIGEVGIVGGEEAGTGKKRERKLN